MKIEQLDVKGFKKRSAADTLSCLFIIFIKHLYCLPVAGYYIKDSHVLGYLYFFVFHVFSIETPNSGVSNAREIFLIISMICVDGSGFV